MPRTKFYKKKLTEQIRKVSKQPVASKPDTKSDSLISTGSTLLNLACSDKLHGAFLPGKMVNLIGDSSSGKTLIALSVFAEMARQKQFNDYRFIYDDVEAACEFDIEKLFNKSTATRIETPDDNESSNTIESFQANIFDALNNKRPFVYVLDSLDALDAEDDQKKAQENIKARHEDKEIKGSYGMAKPKMMSSILRQVVRNLKKTKSLLIIISQTRDNINPMSFTKKTRSGGRALQFYASHEIWLAVAKKLKKKDNVIGIVCRAKVTKNKLTGKVREVEFPLLTGYGIDDVDSCIDYLVKEGQWQKGKQKAKMIDQIEKEDSEEKLYKLVSKVWHKVEESIKPKRKRKYL